MLVALFYLAYIFRLLFLVPSWTQLLRMMVGYLLLVICWGMAVHIDMFHEIVAWARWYLWWMGFWLILEIRAHILTWGPILSSIWRLLQRGWTGLHLIRLYLQVPYLRLVQFLSQDFLPGLCATVENALFQMGLSLWKALLSAVEFVRPAAITASTLWRVTLFSVSLPTVIRAMNSPAWIFALSSVRLIVALLLLLINCVCVVYWLLCLCRWLQTSTAGTSGRVENDTTPTGYLDDDNDEFPVDEEGHIMPSAVIPESELEYFSDPRCRKISAICGREVRLKMGCPTRRPENVAIATQRIEAWLTENYPHMRDADRKYAAVRARFHALVPSADEMDVAYALNSVEVSRRERVVHGVHYVPLYAWLPSWIQFLFGWVQPANAGF